MTRKRICGYCGKPLEGAGYPGIKEKEMCYCSPECRKKHEAALVKIRKNLKWFAAGIAASVLLVLHSAFAGEAAGRAARGLFRYSCKFRGGYCNSNQRMV